MRSIVAPRTACPLTAKISRNAAKQNLSEIPLARVTRENTSQGALHASDGFRSRLAAERKPSVADIGIDRAATAQRKRAIVGVTRYLT